MSWLLHKSLDFKDNISSSCFVKSFDWLWDIGGKARKKEPLKRPRRRWVDNIKTELREIGWGWYGLD
jgi:hypothetical protein